MDRLTVSEREEYKNLQSKIIKREINKDVTINWFDNIKDANRFGNLVRKLGRKYRSGPYKGMNCTREPERDVDCQFAVTE